MNGMAICAGVAGLELGLSLVEPGYRTVCYIEREAYAVAVLRKRMEETHLDEAPVWDDVKTFDGRPWRGKVDIITAGFPCQPWSCAGKREGKEDERWIWPDIDRIIGEVRPRYVFLENVPGLYSWYDTEPTPRPEEIKEGVDLGGGRRRVAVEVEQRQGVTQILGDLSELLFDCEGISLSAAAVGAPHKRERVWILAHASSKRELRLSEGQGAEREGEADPLRGGQDVENSRHRGRRGFRPIEEGKNSQGEWTANNSKPPGSSWWAVEPPLGRVVNGLPYRVDRIRACGNGVVPLGAATAYIILKGRIGGV